MNLVRGVPAVLILVSAACLGPMGKVENGEGALSPDAGGSGCDAAPVEGCPCATPGAVTSCTFVGGENGGTCASGLRTCGRDATWGACLSDASTCGGEPDAGATGSPDAGACFAPSDGGVSASCTPSAVRWCDDGSCFWGQQTCGPDGNWGPCIDTPGNAGPSACPAGSIWYDENCCEQSGQCCAHAIDGENTQVSVGDCASAADACHACTQLCAPGASRWCSVDTDVEAPPGQGTWGQQSCGTDGTWGACATSSSTPAGCAGPTFDATCCQASGACCEVFDQENADPISVGCPATACDGMPGWDGGDAAGGNRGLP